MLLNFSALFQHPARCVLALLLDFDESRWPTATRSTCVSGFIGTLCCLILTAFIILLLVPVLYAIFVLDLKLVKWETTPEPDQHSLFG